MGQQYTGSGAIHSLALGANRYESNLSTGKKAKKQSKKEANHGSRANLKARIKWCIGGAGWRFGC